MDETSGPAPVARGCVRPVVQAYPVDVSFPAGRGWWCLSCRATFPAPEDAAAHSVPASSTPHRSHARLHAPARRGSRPHPRRQDLGVGSGARNDDGPQERDEQGVDFAGTGRVPSAGPDVPGPGGVVRRAGWRLPGWPRS